MPDADGGSAAEVRGVLDRKGPRDRSVGLGTVGGVPKLLEKGCGGKQVVGGVHCGNVV